MLQLNFATDNVSKYMQTVLFRVSYTYLQFTNFA